MKLTIEHTMNWDKIVVIIAYMIEIEKPITKKEVKANLMTMLYYKGAEWFAYPDENIGDYYTDELRPEAEKVARKLYPALAPR